MMYRQLVLSGVMTVICLLIVGCGGGSTSTVKIQENSDQGAAVSLPAEYERNYSQDTTAIYGKGTALSTDLQTAVDKANLAAAAELGTLLESKIERYRTNIVRDDAGANQSESSYKDAVKQVVSQSLRGTEEQFRKVFTEAGRYRAYVVLKLPVGKANKVLLDQIQKDEKLWKLFMDEKLLKELEEQVTKYEASKS